MSWDAEAPSIRRSLAGKMHSKFGYFRVVSLLSILNLFLIFSFNIGISAAKSKSNFLVFNEISEYVVLKIFGNILVSAQFQRTERQVVQKFVLNKVGESPGLRLSLERVGPLKVIPRRSTPAEP